MEMEQAKVRAEFKATENRTASESLQATHGGHRSGTEHRDQERAQSTLQPGGQEQRKREREWEEELMRKRQRQAEEVEELKALHCSLVHEAQPIKQYPSPIIVKPTNRPATVPRSPVITSLSCTRSHTNLLILIYFMFSLK